MVIYLHILLLDFNGHRSWPVAVAPGAQMDCQIVHEAVVEDTIAAWKFLLDNAAALARKWSVPPESLILSECLTHLFDFRYIFKYLQSLTQAQTVIFRSMILPERLKSGRTASCPPSGGHSRGFLESCTC
jgi:hypothetical protein